jgi:Coenzyme PQQ synthesis protein D (PqqD)/IPT/TIG domain
MYPRQSPTTHTEQLGDEASVYDWARAQVHALNPTAAGVWRQCDGATSPDAIAAALRRELGIPEAEAVVALTLRQFARLHLLELPVASCGDRPATTRRWLLRRGVAAVMLPAIHSIVAPSPVEAQSPGRAGPTLTSVAPNQGIRGSTVVVTLTGTNFVIGVTTVTVGGGGVSVTSVTVSSVTSLTATFVLDAAATEGPRTVTVSTAWGTSGGQTFTVSLPSPVAPTLTSVLPNQGTRGSTVAVTLTGTNFVVGATTVAVGGGGVTVTNVVVGSSTSLTATFVLDAAATEGPRMVTVTTAGGTSDAQTFTVSLPAPPAPVAPTLTSVAPNQGIRGTTVAVTLTGTNFVVGATTVAVGGGGVTVNNVVVGSSTSLTASFVLDPAATEGPRTVTVTTAGGTSGAQTFAINLPPPTLSSVSPNQGTLGTTVPVTLTGTNFVVGATTVNVSGAGVTVNNVVVGSSTSLTANLVLDPAAAAGARTVTVTTAGGTSGPQTFTISLPPPAPTLTSVSPNQGLRGSTVAVTLTGTNFVVGATTVTVAGGGVTVTNVVVGSSTSLTASFGLDLAAGGARAVTVTTAGGTSGAQTFTVTLPVAGSVTFNFTGGDQTFTVPAGVVSITILATGASGSPGFGAVGGTGGLGGRTTATVSVTPGASLTVRVGGQGIGAVGSFTGLGGGAGGASSVRNGATSLVVVGGGGGGGAEATGGSVGGGNGAAGGGLMADPGLGANGAGGGGGTQSLGGAGGMAASAGGSAGTAGLVDTGGIGGNNMAFVAGGGGGAGYFGGGGGGCGIPSIAGGGGGGGGSSFAAPGATAVLHEKGVKAANGFVTITW